METFKKRQKAWARKEKQQKKALRRMERRNEKPGPDKGGESHSAIGGEGDKPNSQVSAPRAGS